MSTVQRAERPRQRASSGQIAFAVVAWVALDHMVLGWLPTWALGSTLVVLAATVLVIFFTRIWKAVVVGTVLFAVYLAWVNQFAPGAVRQLPGLFVNAVRNGPQPSARR